MVSTVVFDFDGTLVDSNAIKRRGFFDVVAGDADGAARMERVLQRISGDRHAVLAAYCNDATSMGMGSPQLIDTLVRLYSDRVDSLVAAACEVPGATLLLEQLRQEGLRLYISSATPVISLRRILEQRQWLQLFDGIYGLPASKRESLLRIRDIKGLNAASIAVVGDGADDRDSAEFLGCLYLPVGEARGTAQGERVFKLPELLNILRAS